ncbi:hypothetical protein BDW74DRAFT_29391 [Aspergillus multicolor]|uniref:DUF4246 domain-containing protein n=1 Tax=Aspergillus multicolor TaxID=41759 RepID=UPI003CCCE142
MSSGQDTPFDLPGLTLPVHYMPEYYDLEHKFSHALDPEDVENGYCGCTFTLGELTMMRIMETITDKPDWTTKIDNDEITSKWEREILESGLDVSDLMIEYIFKELSWKAQQYAKMGIVMAYDPGVVKSDVVIPQDLQQKLRNAVKPLEEVPEVKKDYHPGSDGKVVDLVHPSLFPLVYGRTRVLYDSIIDVGNCLSNIGQGKVAGIAEDTGPLFSGRRYGDRVEEYSKRFQWLPCNVEFGPEGECRIVSYINNLHPIKHRDLYRVIEQIITRTIPLWNISITQRDDLPRRIEYETADYHPDEEPEPEYNGQQDYFERYDAWSDKRKPKQPEPNPDLFQPPVGPTHELVNLYDSFRDKGLQVIVKLANIELTPDKPEYEGGSWHVEGQLNERICATAIYYYDCENITENTLSFRHRADVDYIQDVSYEQGQFEFLRVFGFDRNAGSSDDAPITQDLGGVSCRTGRLLTFPNTLQHRVSPFSLADRSKPGHRKIVALFLIDPNRRIISTANVPPQREDWCNEWIETTYDLLASRLPVELQDIIHEHLDFTPMTMDEAKVYRQELMDERSSKSESENDLFTLGGFSLCEH